MIGTIRAEFRKLFTVRSTYVLIGLGIVFVIFYAFYIQGYRLTGADLQNSHLFSQDVTNAITSLPLVFGAIVAILLMAHEYRYNTIMYALTSSNSRSKVLAAKFIIITVLGLVLALIVGYLAPLMSYLGVHAHGHVLVPQMIDYGSLLWRGLFYGWGYLSLALLLAAIVRNQIAAIVSIFVIPTFEAVLSLLLKHNAVYLPFTALGGVLSTPTEGSITYARAALVSVIWLVFGWLVAWILFLRRDAN